MKSTSSTTLSEKSTHKETPAERWLSYRPEIRVLDCTIRDGGLMNNHQFDDKGVKAVYDACVAAGIDYMEIGYRASRKDLQWGFDLPYMITGLYNQHPRAAIKYKAQPEKGDIGGFYDSVLAGG